MPEYDYWFRTINQYNYTYPTLILWQAWHEAYFRIIGSVLYADGEPVRLFESGCTADSWMAPNCTRTCSDPKYMFSSPENVWNCMTLAAVTMEVVPGNKTVDPVNLKEMDDQFDFGGSLEAFDKLHVFTRVRRCFWQSCSDSKYGNCTSELEDFRCGPVSPGNIRDFDRAINHAYCRDANLGVDSDIAGPGILVAYMVQTTLAFILAGLFWATYQPWKRFKTMTREFLAVFGRASTSRTNTQISFEASQPCCVGSSLGHLISELQEAQSAFCIVIGVIFICAFAGISRLGLANISSVLSYSVNHDIAFGLLVSTSWEGLPHFSWTLFLVDLMSFIMMIICLVEVVITFKKLQELKGGQYSWGFGQPVSMAVWIPVVANFFAFLIVGTEEGTEARIHKDLQVSRVGTFVRVSQGMPGENGSDEGQNFPLLAAVPSTASIQVMESNAPVGPLDADRP